MKRFSILPVVFACGVLPIAFAMLPETSLRAQGTGPMQPAPPAIPHAPLSHKPETPAISPEQIIQKFAANEDLMISAASEYSFEKDVRLEEIGPDNKPAGSLEIVTQQVSGTDGKRYEKTVKRSPSTLRFLEMERGDMGVIDSAPLFPFTSTQLPKYDITYEGTQPLDELSVYVFDVKPHSLERSHAYFSGVIWVDQTAFVIVKTFGKWVTETGDVTSAALPFTMFETYREQVGKNEWFPTYSRSDATLNQGGNQVSIRLITRWSKYTKGQLPTTPDAPADQKPPSGP